MAEVKYLDKTGLGTVWSKVKGIVTPKADKVSGATNGHLAGLNSSGNLTDSGLAALNIAQKDGSYSGMTVGAAEDLVSAESVASEFTSRITGGSTAVGKGGTALVDKIKGRTLVWNQLVQNGNFVGDNYSPAWTLSANVNASFSSRILTLSNLTGSIYFSQGRRIEQGHKVLLAVKAGYFYDGTKTGSATFFAINGSNTLSLPIDNTLSERKYILTAPSISDNVLGFTTYIPGGTAGVTLKIDCDYGVSVIDLTLMFGAGNEPSTVAEFEALYPGPYYDYNPGTLISNAATAIETVGFNQWDEEWEVGAYNDSTGVPVITTNNLRSKVNTPISVFPNTEYCFTGGAFRVLFYDSEMNFILKLNVSSGKTVTTPANCCYISFYMSSGYGVTYLNDICISLSDPSRNGTYEPYWRSELELNIPTLTGKLNGTGNSVVIFPDGLRSAGTVFDEIVGNKAIKRIGAVDLGSMTWGSDTYREHTRFFSALADSKTNSSAYQLANQINSYGYISTPKVAVDNTVNLGLSKYNNSIYIRNDAYEGQNGSVFAAAMSGVMLYYELATPEEYILDEAVPTAMRNDPYGTERRLPEDTAAIVTTPFRADITYSTNIKEAVQSMHQNFINVNSMQDFLAELGTLMGGTWTMRPADGKFDFTFTPNPSNE